MTGKKQKPWPVACLPETRYRVSVIACLYKMNIGEVIDRAVVAYANVLRLADKMEIEFPREGLQAPARRTRLRKQPNLSKFREHAEWFANRKIQNPSETPIEESEDEPS